MVLTNDIDLKKINAENLFFLRFKELSRKYLLTNDVGDFIFLPKDDFKAFAEDNFDTKKPIYQELCAKNFVHSRFNRFKFIEQYRINNSFIWAGPTLHIMVVTLRCNHGCLYCQSSARGMSEKKYDMDVHTAKKIVDIIFESPSNKITIELQGGEPLANWDTVKFICNYALKKNKSFKKSLVITMVSNLTLLTEERLKFLIDKNVAICISLDGPQPVHDKNRKLVSGKSSYGLLMQKIKMIKKKYITDGKINALLTLSKSSFSCPEKIIDEYLKFGFREIHLRPVSNLGMSKINKNVVGYDADEFIRFYKTALGYLLKLNLENKTAMSERTARIFLTKILLKSNPNYLDMRSPCGAGIGQLLYNYDGRVYTCDEARMLGEDAFLIGEVGRHSYKDIVNSKVISATCFASCLESTFCDYCVYKPYCGNCPVVNYAESGNLFGQLPKSRMCRISMAILDYLFEKVEDKKYKEIFMKWVNFS